MGTKKQTKIEKILRMRIEKDGVVYEEKGDIKNFLNYPIGLDTEYATGAQIELEFVMSGKLQIEKLPLRAVIEAAELIENGKELRETTQRNHPYLSDLIYYIGREVDDEISVKNSICEYDYEYPVFSFSDITDYKFNCLGKISQQELGAKGLWVGSGMRHIETEIENIDLFYFCAKKYKNNKIIDAMLVLDKVGNTTLKNDDLIKFDVKMRKNKQLVIEFDIDNKDLEKYLTDTAQVPFSGNFVISIHKVEREERDADTTYRFYFPFKIMITNPAIKQGIHQNNEIVAIDFGTSSTCVAYDCGDKMIAFTDKGNKTGDDYENPTALMIYNWAKIYKSWKSSNLTFPDFERSSTDADTLLDEGLKDVAYDYGHKVKKELSAIKNSETINAIISNIKSLPGKLESQNAHEVAVPFDQKLAELFLTDDIEKEDDKTLNPIAFYGYLIGRSLNLQSKNKIYTDFQLTMPVSFNPNKREKIKNSLEYGLKRSLPKSLKDKLDVDNEYEESVALIGAINELEILEPDEDKNATPFAIFDLGGGTLDFAFGIFRMSEDEINKNLIDKLGKPFDERRHEEIIEIFNTGGPDIGGETLIDMISYKLYELHQKEMGEKQIPITVPKRCKQISSLSDKLFGDNHFNHSNLKAISEGISREFFINQKSGEIKIDLQTLNKEAIEFTFEISEEVLDLLMKTEIKELVEEFYEQLILNFTKYENRLNEYGFENFNVNDVKIFKAGNASKAIWIEQAFNSVFKDYPNLSISFVETNENKRSDDFMENITPKNAVAKGVLLLNGIGVYNHENGDVEPLDRFIFSLRSARKKKSVLARGAMPSDGWVELCKHSNQRFDLYTCDISNITGRKDSKLVKKSYAIDLEIFNEDLFTVYIKPENESKIKYVLSDNKENIKEENARTLDLKQGD